MEIKKLDSPVSISNSALVRLKEMGNITEIMYSEKRSRGGYITKIDKDHYVDNRTGELFEFKHLENRAQDLANVAKSLAQGRDILNANITDVSRCRWVTLTYADNMTGINWSTIPVTIVEMGFMTNESDDLKMSDPDFQDTMASGIADGIDAYFEEK